MHGLYALLPLIAGVARAVVQVVPFDDSRILYSGTGWHADVFEIRPGIDPATGGGVNGTSSPVCALGDRSTSSGVIGDKFVFSFTGTSVQLVMESRDDHGFMDVSVDQISSQVSGYSVSPHCGVMFEQGPLAMGPHTVAVTLAGRNPASRWPTTYMQLFSIRFDDGLSASSSSSTNTRSTSSPSGTPGSSNGGDNTNDADATPVGHSNTGAIAGGVIGGILAGLALAALATFLVVRHKRSARQQDRSFQDQELMNPTPWTPGPSGGSPPPPPPHGGTTQRFYNNATSYYPSEPSDFGAGPTTEVTGYQSTYPVSVPSIHRSGGGTLHDEDVERIAGRLAQLVQQGNVPATAYSGSVYNEGAYDGVSSGVSYNGPAPTSPPPGAAAPQPPTAKQLYMARQQAPDAPGVNRAHGADEPPPAY